MPSNAQSRPRILVIDDSRLVLRILKRELEEKGYAVEVAESGATGVELATASRFDLVVIDGVMPGMDGFEVCSEIARTKVSGRPLLVMHSNISKDYSDRQRAATAGADDFALKTLDGGELVEKVLHLLPPTGPTSEQ